MELKCVMLADCLPTPTGFNRTFMELKFRREKKANSEGPSFNRTFMELKSWR